MEKGTKVFPSFSFLPSSFSPFLQDFEKDSFVNRKREIFQSESGSSFFVMNFVLGSRVLFSAPRLLAALPPRVANASSIASGSISLKG